MNMKRSRNVTLILLAAVAAAACDEQNEIKHCVDEDGVVQDEDKCKDAPAQAPLESDGGVVHKTDTGHSFFWYYGGTRTPITPGGRVGGGSYKPSSGISYTPSSGVSKGGESIFSGGGGGKSVGGTSSPSIGRGGFGSTGSGHASGGGS